MCINKYSLKLNIKHPHHLLGVMFLKTSMNVKTTMHEVKTSWENGVRGTEITYNIISIIND
jgi:hypothetical protein